MKSIIANEQYSTIYKDTCELAKVTASMAEAVLKGRTPLQLNNLNDYDNGVKVVPAFLLNPVSVDKANYHRVLVESGYYTDDQLRWPDGDRERLSLETSVASLAVRGRQGCGRSRCTAELEPATRLRRRVAHRRTTRASGTARSRPAVR
ncbi:hypothetical protein [Lentzea sp. DG1S-22]|uniref:hypothetical protein n=1 Tax=Lentzea sp. DG1S-22 TaxID=3108822 RepID=UPI003FA5F432